jgi:cell shape-determining protein MreC
MNYLLKSKPKGGNKGKLLSIAAAYILLSLVGFFFGASFRRFAWATARPVWAAGTLIASPFSSIWGYVHFKGTLVRENLALQEENADLRVKQTGYDALLLENETLKSELGRAGSSPKVLSAILSSPPRSPYDTLVVDLGSSDGILQGSKVFAGDNLIVGLVTTVTPHTSLVALFSGEGQKQEAIVARTGASFVLSGKGGQNFELLVPKDADIVWGDTFVYPGLSQSVIATVYYIDTDSQSSFKTAYLRIPTNIFAEKYVFLEKSG